MQVSFLSNEKFGLTKTSSNYNLALQRKVIICTIITFLPWANYLTKTSSNYILSNISCHLFLVRSLFSFFLSRNLSSWISMIVYLRVCHNLIRIWDEEKIILFQSGVLILPLFGTQEIRPLIIKTWQPFELQLLHSFVYDRTSWEFLFVISTCRLGILILQKQRKILATMLVMWVRIVSLLNLHL